MAAHSHDFFDYLLKMQEEKRLQEGFPNASFGRAAYYPPCHTRSVYGDAPALEVMRQTGAEVCPVRYSTCCGMAGTFGFKKGLEGYEVSMAVGETLFQRIRAVDPDFVMTESGVCKMHIEHRTSLEVVHPAIALWQAYGKRAELTR